MSRQRTTPSQSPLSQLSKASQSFQQNPTILIVEDEPITAKVTRNTLDKLGYQSSVAKDGQQAINKLSHDPNAWSILLMDINMPNLNGLQTTQKLRQQGFDSERWPIIGYSTSEPCEAEHACEQMGMNDYLQKPAQQDDLKQTLHHYYLQVKKVEKQQQLQSGDQPHQSIETDEQRGSHQISLRF